MRDMDEHEAGRWRAMGEAAKIEEMLRIAAAIRLDNMDVLAIGEREGI